MRQQRALRTPGQRQHIRIDQQGDRHQHADQNEFCDHLVGNAKPANLDDHAGIKRTPARYTQRNQRSTGKEQQEEGACDDVVKGGEQSPPSTHSGQQNRDAKAVGNGDRRQGDKHADPMAGDQNLKQTRFV